MNVGAFMPCIPRLSLGLRRALTLVAAAASVGLASSADALPRFAARSGNECIQCHVSPSGGGPRNRYGRNIFERVWLSLPPSVDSASHDDETEAQRTADDPFLSFSGDITDWLAVGGDTRVAYLWVRPDRGVDGAERDITDSFFLMQADLYLSAKVHEHVGLVLDLGVYSGFEAWAEFRLNPEPEDIDLIVRVGRFMPAFGVRDPSHQLYTRAGIGLGNADRDTGLEATVFLGPFTAAISLLNGTLGDTAFDTHGVERRTFEKAIVARPTLSGDFGWLRGQIGASVYYSMANSQANPLFDNSLSLDAQGEAGAGVDELRANGFLMANAGRFTYVADFVFVRDDFYSEKLSPLMGYAAYQELAFVPTQGVELVATFEYQDPDLDVLDNAAMRGGLAIEFYPWLFTEFRLMARRTWNDSAPTGGAWDVVFFTHVFL